MAVQNMEAAGAPGLHHSFRGLILRRALRTRSVVAGSVLLLILIMVAILAPHLTSYDPVVPNPPDRMQSPNAVHWFGTDQYGRDVFARVIYGGRISLVMGVVPIAIASSIGILVGLISGYYGGLIDLLIMRLVDVAVAFPSILLALAIVAVLGPGLTNVMIAMGIAWIPYYVRMVRGSAMQAKQATYVEAARAVGGTDVRIISRHILYNVMAPVLVMASMGVAGAILTGASLSFLGLGAQQPTPEWGAILADARQFIRLGWWIGLFPGIAIAVTVLALNILGDGLRDVLDPRLKR